MTTAPEQATERRELTADDLVRGIHEAMRARDFDAVVAFLHVLAAVDPHLAGTNYDTIQLGCTLALPTQPEEPPMNTDAATREQRLKALTDDLLSGGPITAQHAVELAAAVVQIAGSDSYLASENRVLSDDERVLLAQVVLARAKQSDAIVLDEFARETMERCLIARARNGGHPLDTWEPHEKLAVALVLHDHTYLAQAGFTAERAAKAIADNMAPPPADMRTWVEGVRAAIAEEAKR
ncbi:MAG TPA: hypothetical protein VGL02_05620 [Streptomyces sp.]